MTCDAESRTRNLNDDPRGAGLESDGDWQCGTSLFTGHSDFHAFAIFHRAQHRDQSAIHKISVLDRLSRFLQKIMLSELYKGQLGENRSGFLRRKIEEKLIPDRISLNLGDWFSDCSCPARFVGRDGSLRRETLRRLRRQPSEMDGTGTEHYTKCNLRNSWSQGYPVPFCSLSEWIFRMAV